MIVAKLLATWLITDFISGFIHWLEDSYGHPNTPIIGRYITRPDLRHHFVPREFVTNSWFSSADLLVIVCCSALLIAWAVGHLSPMVLFAAALGVNANQVHKWCHRTPAENGAFITWLQRLHLVQSPRQHRGHHVGNKDACYCVLTDVLNPVLDRCRFWRALEHLVYSITGVRKRDDAALLALLLDDDPSFLDTVRRSAT